MDFVDLLLHSDRYLLDLVGDLRRLDSRHPVSIVFAETGLVVTPFLPGDSLLFAAGALGASGALDARVAAVTLITAAVLGNTVNYAIGDRVGPRSFILRKPTRAGGAGSIRTTSPERTRSSRSTAARPSS